MLVFLIKLSQPLMKFSAELPRRNYAPNFSFFCMLIEKFFIWRKKNLRFSENKHIYIMKFKFRTQANLWINLKNFFFIDYNFRQNWCTNLQDFFFWKEQNASNNLKNSNKHQSVQTHRRKSQEKTTQKISYV